MGHHARLRLTNKVGGGLRRVLSLLWFVMAFMPIRTILAEEIRYRGVSSYSAMAPNFPCSRFLQIAERAKNPALAILWKTFGDSPECARQFFQRFKDRPTFLE